MWDREHHLPNSWKGDAYPGEAEIDIGQSGQRKGCFETTRVCRVEDNGWRCLRFGIGIGIGVGIDTQNLEKTAPCAHTMDSDWATEARSKLAMPMQKVLLDAHWHVCFNGLVKPALTHACRRKSHQGGLELALPVVRDSGGR